MTRYRGNYSEDNTDGEGERMPRGRKEGGQGSTRGGGGQNEMKNKSGELQNVL